MKTFVLGDVHGAFKALKQVLTRSQFDYENDLLISVGDIVDGWPDVVECIEELLKIKNLICIRGNHDTWAYLMLKERVADELWLKAWGGQATLESYLKHDKSSDSRHLRFFEKQLPYYIDDQNRLFVHGGLDIEVNIQSQSLDDLSFNRTLWKTAIHLHENGGTFDATSIYNEIYIGHTQTVEKFPDALPVNLFNIWNMDQGCKSLGKLSLMNVDTKEVFQSDWIYMLYSEVI